MKDYLIDDELFLNNVKDYENCDLHRVNYPDTVGIVSKIIDDRRMYIAYLNNEHGSVDLIKPCDTFDEALKEARGWYEKLMLIIKKEDTLLMKRLK